MIERQASSVYTSSTSGDETQSEPGTSAVEQPVERTSALDWLSKALPEPVEGNVQEAVQFILDSSGSDASTLLQLRNACNVVSAFLKAASRLSNPNEPVLPQELRDLASDSIQRILTQEFISALLAVRQRTRDHALVDTHIADPYLATAPDALLARILLLLRCFQTRSPQSEEEQSQDPVSRALYVAIRLPSSWSALGNALIHASADASVKHAVIALMYCGSCLPAMSKDEVPAHKLPFSHAEALKRYITGIAEPETLSPMIRAFIVCIACMHLMDDEGPLTRADNCTDDHLTGYLLHITVTLFTPRQNAPPGSELWAARCTFLIHASKTLPWLWRRGGHAPVNDPVSWLAEITLLWLRENHSIDYDTFALWRRTGAYEIESQAHKHLEHARLLLQDGCLGLKLVIYLLEQLAESYKGGQEQSQKCQSQMLAIIAGLGSWILQALKGSNPPVEFLTFCSMLCFMITITSSGLDNGKALAIKVLASLSPAQIRAAIDGSGLKIFEVLDATSAAVEAAATEAGRKEKGKARESSAIEYGEEAESSQPLSLLALVILLCGAEGPFDRRILKPVTFLARLRAALKPGRAQLLSSSVLMAIVQLLLTVEERAEGGWTLDAATIADVSEALLNISDSDDFARSTTISRLLTLHASGLAARHDLGVFLFDVARSDLATIIHEHVDSEGKDSDNEVAATLTLGLCQYLHAMDEDLCAYLLEAPLSQMLQLQAHAAAVDDAPPWLGMLKKTLEAGAYGQNGAALGADTKRQVTPFSLRALLVHGHVLLMGLSHM